MGMELESVQCHCAVAGVIGDPEACRLVYKALSEMQNRGHEFSGIVSYSGNRPEHLRQLRLPGLVLSSFDKFHLEFLRGNPSIGHNRYATAGKSDEINSQPHVDAEAGLALAANGDIPPVQYRQWRDCLKGEGVALASNNDGELLLKIISWRKSQGDSTALAISYLLSNVQGAFSAVLIDNCELYAFRDRLGMRPLVWGRREDGTYVFVSETRALLALGIKDYREVEPGEIVYVRADGEFETFAQLEPPPHFAHCVFCGIYFGGPTSTIFGKPDSLFREEIGRILAGKIKVEADIVCPVPNSANIAAIAVAEALGLPFRFGLICDSYNSKRSFIANDQAEREELVRRKLIPNGVYLAGKRVILVDDSIVRATTARIIVQMLREAGATEVHLAITSPKIIGSCFYGIDTPDQAKLVGSDRTVEEIRCLLGADSLTYLEVNDLKAAVASFGKNPENYCYACFNLDYPTSL